MQTGGFRTGLWGQSDLFDCLFHVGSFLTPLFAIGNITI